MHGITKARRGESPIIKTYNLITSALGGSSRKAKETPVSNFEKVDGNKSTKKGNKKSSNYFRQSQITFGGSKNLSKIKTESSNFGIMMSKGPL